MLAGLFDYPWNDQDSHDEYGTASLWMDDYTAAALGTLASRGFPKANTILDWQANVLAGRYISKDLGLNPLNGGIYQLPDTKSFTAHAVHGPQNSSQGFAFTTWREVQAAIEAKGQNITVFAHGTVSPIEITTKSMNGIAAMMSYAKSIDAYEAFGFLAEGTLAKRGGIDFSLGPRNSIQPLLPDGTLLTLGRMRAGSNGVDHLIGTSTSELISGGDGNDTIEGFGGIDLLYGGTGDDQLFGGDGTDYLFGNDGADRLFGGAGNDVLRGNVGADVLDGGSGDDTIFLQDNDTIIGGTGMDTLSLQNWRQAAIDVRTGKFTGIESIDLRNSPNYDVRIVDTLILDITTLATISDTNSLQVRADSIDNVTILGNPVRLPDVTLEGDYFAQFSKGDSRIYVLMGTSVNGTALSGLPIGEGEVQTVDRDPFDVSGDQVVMPLDALQIIDFLTQVGARSTNSSSFVNATQDAWRQFDVDGNGQVTPLDALMVINRLNSIASRTALVVSGEQATDSTDSVELLKRKWQLSRSQL